MIRRELNDELLDASREYPVVTIFGPRQSGKTTLARAAFPDLPYFSIENPDIRAAASADPRGFLNAMNGRGVLDEIQRAPELLSYLQEIVDTRKKECRFILTGSHQPLLSESVAQSLPGRTSVSTLMPFTRAELAQYSRSQTVFEQIVTGGYPAIHEESLDLRRFFRSYVQTYVERDLRALAAVQDLGRFQQFLTLLAGRIGQLVNLSALSSDVGVSSTTLRAWLNVLKACYLVVELPPWHANIRKRLTRSAKLYFTDTGLACFLLGIDSAERLKVDRMRGGLFENHVIMDIWKTLLHLGEVPSLFFYRDSHGHEVDLLIQRSQQIIPVEIKSSETFSASFTAGLKHFAGVVDGAADSGLIVYAGTQPFIVDGVRITPIDQFSIRDLEPISR